MASDSSIWLFVLCFSMLSGSFLSGIVPLVFPLSEAKLHVATTFGAGLLVGTALGVIVPEGVETLYHAYRAGGADGVTSDHTHSAVAAASTTGGGSPTNKRAEVSGKGLAERLGELPAAAGAGDERVTRTAPHGVGDSPASRRVVRRGSRRRREGASADPAPEVGLPGGLRRSTEPDALGRIDRRSSGPAVPGSPSPLGNWDRPSETLRKSRFWQASGGTRDPRAAEPQLSGAQLGDPAQEGNDFSPNDSDEQVIPPGEGPAPEQHDHEHHHDEDSPHWLVGGALTAGFAFMLVVERFGHAHHHRSATNHQVDLANFATIPLAYLAEEGGTLLPGGRPAAAQHGSGSTTLGMIVHAAADGVALGAACSSSQPNLEAIVFLAVMLHKAPAAFGLSMYLLHDGVPRRQIQQHLLAFSLAAPFAAILTYFALQGYSSISPSGAGSADSGRWTGLLLLFSGGTFLHVAVHVLNDIGGGSKADQIAAAFARPTSASAGAAAAGDGRITRFLVRQDFLVLLSGVFFPTLFGMKHGH